VRGLAALYVVAYHAGDAAGVDVAPRGYLAVDLFFVLSGFVLALTAAGDFSARGLRACGAFWVRRVARILPLNLAVVGAIVAANFAAHGGGGAPLGRVACNALALQGFGGCVTLNAPAWTLSFEWLAYLAFPVVLRAVLFSRAALCGFVVALAGMALVGLAVCSGRGTLDSSQFGAGWSAIRCGGEMVLGVAALRVYAAPGWRRRAAPDWVFGMVVLLGAAGCFLGERSGGWIGGDVWAVAVFPVLVLCLAANAGQVGRWLGWAPLHGLGVISFSIYLWHDALLQREARALGVWWPGWMGHGGLFVMMAIVSVIPLAWVSHRVVERPGRAAVRCVFLRGGR
jgi:peptidoglycan/LPS O-acetylase OafA/YrhL